MLKTILSFLLMLCLVVAAPAKAADLSAGAAPSAVDWTGFYAGVWGGYRLGNITATACGGGGIIGVNCATNIDLNGGFAGVTAGFDQQLANDLVLGGFVTIPLVAPTAFATTPLFAPLGWHVEPQFAAIAGGRVGLSMGEFMPYALAGVAMTTVKVTSDFTGPSTATHFGGVLGAGTEMKFTDHWSIDTRYMLGYMAPAQYDFCGLPGCQSSYSELSHNFSIGVNYRF